MSRRILIVANQTLASEELMAAVEERVRGGATELLVVVPASPPPGDAFSAIARVEAGAFDPPEALRASEKEEKRLDAALKVWASLGISVSGEVADIDAFKAVGHVLARQGGVDEIIVSTQPTSISHWLRADLPSRLHRKHRIPVSTVTARKPH